jgi:hypothetical protein
MERVPPSCRDDKVDPGIRKTPRAGHPNRQANLDQFAGILEFIHVPEAVKVALAV